MNSLTAFARSADNDLFSNFQFSLFLTNHGQSFEFQAPSQPLTIKQSQPGLNPGRHLSKFTLKMDALE